MTAAANKARMGNEVSKTATTPPSDAAQQEQDVTDYSSVNQLLLQQAANNKSASDSVVTSNLMQNWDVQFSALDEQEIKKKSKQSANDLESKISSSVSMFKGDLQEISDEKSQLRAKESKTQVDNTKSKIDDDEEVEEEIGQKPAEERSERKRQERALIDTYQGVKNFEKFKIRDTEIPELHTGTANKRVLFRYKKDAKREYDDYTKPYHLLIISEDNVIHYRNAGMVTKLYLFIL